MNEDNFFGLNISKIKHDLLGDDMENYKVWAYITGFIVFCISYIYCIASYGFLLGVGLGWLPSLIVGVIAGLLWPIVALSGIGLIIIIAVSIHK